MLIFYYINYFNKIYFLFVKKKIKISVQNLISKNRNVGSFSGAIYKQFHIKNFNLTQKYKSLIFIFLTK